MILEKIIYMDGESEKHRDILGFFVREDGVDVKCAWAGKRFDAFVMTCEENSFTSLQRKRGIFLIFEGNLPKLDFYPVPSLTLFAHDGRSGYFAHGEDGLESPVYFISKELECWYLAENFRAFVQMAVFEPNWKESITGEVWNIEETEEERAAFGMIFGLSVPEEKLSAGIHREDGFTIFAGIEKAKEACLFWEDIIRGEIDFTRKTGL